MAKDPAFLFYPNDWVGGTMGMTFEEKGAYMEVLMMQFNRGHMTEHMIGQTIGQLFGRIKDKFTQDSDGLWYNERLEKEKERRKNYVNSRNNNKLGLNQFKEKKEKKVGHMTNHMEDVNIDSINTIVDASEIIKKDYTMVVVEMYKIWQNKNPIYPKDEQADYHALLTFAYKIAEAKGWKMAEVISSKEFGVISSWDKITDFIMSDNWLRTKPLKTIVGQWQRIYQEMAANGDKTAYLEAKRIKETDYFTE